MATKERKEQAEKLRQEQVSTRKPLKNDDTPKLPHERDESFDSQSSETRDDMEQAHADIERGLVDTDRRGTPGIEQINDDTPARQAPLGGVDDPPGPAKPRP
jgi:hypothetical protein